MAEQYVVSMNKPPKMSVKEFKRTVDKIEQVRNQLSHAEKQKCQEILKIAGMRQSLGKGSLNFCIKPLLPELSELAQQAVELHMKINALPMFLDLVMRDELYTMAENEVAANKAFLISKGYKEIKDYFQKKVWIAGVCRVILISKGIGEKSAQFYRCEAFFKKGEELPFEEKPPIYSQYLRDLVL